MKFTPDIFNGLFEFIGGCFLCLNLKNLYRDKEVKGVSWLPVVFMSSWGVWNLYYYPSLNQWWSFWGGLWIVSVNTIWLGMIYYYYRQKLSVSTPEKKFRKDVKHAELLISKGITDKQWKKVVKNIKKAQRNAPEPIVLHRSGIIRRSPSRRTF